MQCPLGGYVYFRWTAAVHDVQLMASKAHLESCDFTGATELVGVGQGANSAGEASYYLPCAEAGATYYLSCSVGSHCAAGQKVSVTVVPAFRRFEFADGVDGLWSTSKASVYASRGAVQCPLGGYVYFRWTAAVHDVQLMASKAHLESCDFTGATELVGVGQGANSAGEASYYLPCAEAGATYYLSCSVGSHCAAGQALSVHVSNSERVTNETDGSLRIHSDSLSRAEVAHSNSTYPLELKCTTHARQRQHGSAHQCMRQLLTYSSNI